MQSLYCLLALVYSSINKHQTVDMIMMPCGRKVLGFIVQPNKTSIIIYLSANYLQSTPPYCAADGSLL